jgi:hypothetical protein
MALATAGVFFHIPTGPLHKIADELDVEIGLVGMPTCFAPINLFFCG